MTRQAPNGPAMTLHIPDYLEYGNATALAQRIKLYWQVRGHQVKVWVEAICLTDTHVGKPTYAVRSDMVGGRPI